MSIKAKAALNDHETLRMFFLAGASDRGNTGLFATILASWIQGGGALPSWLGLSSLEFRKLLKKDFPNLSFTGITGRESANLDYQRALEWNDLRRYLLRNRAHRCPSEVWMVDIVSAACMGASHLWQDLGLRNRGELSALMKRNFPRLASKNRKDMKWKKFIYRELCQAEGVYVCRSPTCEACSDYDNCFGPEE